MRSLRAGVFAASSVALAATAHRLGGGMQPTGKVIAVAVAVLFGFGLVWARRERHGAGIAAVVLASQLGLHAAFALAPSTSMTSGTSTSELNRWAAMLLCHTAGHPATAAQVNAARAALGLGPLPQVPMAMHMASPFTTGGAAMLATHLVAGVAMAWWLRRGERAAWAGARRIVRAVLTGVRSVHPLVPPVATLRAAGTAWTPRRWTWRTGLAGRGPPGALVTVLTA